MRLLLLTGLLEAVEIMRERLGSAIWSLRCRVRPLAYLIGCCLVFSLLWQLPSRLSITSMEPRTMHEAYAATMGAVFDGTRDAVIQQLDKSCGPAALAHLLQTHGVLVSEQEIVSVTGLTEDGTTLLGLAHAAERFGFQATGMRLSYPNLSTIPKPAIVHLKQGHFVTLVEVDTGGVMVMDPLVGYLRFTPQSFRKNWSGVVLVISPGKGGFLS